MWRETYRTLFTCVLSFYTIQRWCFVESRRINEERVMKIGLAKKYSLGCEVEADFGRMMTKVAIAGGTLGIGITALPNELSSRAIDSPDELDISNIFEKTNNVTVFGMHPGIWSMHNNAQYSPIPENNEAIKSPSELSLIAESEETGGHENDLSSTKGLYKHSNSIQTIKRTGAARNSTDADTGVGLTSQPCQQLTPEQRLLITESNGNNEENMQGNQNYTKLQKGTKDSRTANKKGKIRIYAAVVGTLLVFGIVITAVILKYTIMNKEEPIQKLHRLNDTISVATTNPADQTQKAGDQTQKAVDQTQKAVDQITETIDQTTETFYQTTERTTEQWPTTEQDGINGTSQAGIAVTVQNANDEHISPPADICQQYENATKICDISEPEEKTDCLNKMLSCMSVSEAETNIALPKSCQTVINGTSIQENLFEKFKERLNAEIASVGNITNMNCATALTGFRRTISNITSHYGCESDREFLGQVSLSSSTACNRLISRDENLARLCLAQQNAVTFLGTESLRADIMGAMGENLQNRMVDCAKQNDQNYYLKYFSSHDDS